MRKHDSRPSRLADDTAEGLARTNNQIEHVSTVARAIIPYVLRQSQRGVRQSAMVPRPAQQIGPMPYATGIEWLAAGAAREPGAARIGTDQVPIVRRHYDAHSPTSTVRRQLSEDAGRQDVIEVVQ